MKGVSFQEFRAQTSSMHTPADNATRQSIELKPAIDHEAVTITPVVLDPRTSSQSFESPNDSALQPAKRQRTDSADSVAAGAQVRDYVQHGSNGLCG